MGQQFRRNAATAVDLLRRVWPQFGLWPTDGRRSLATKAGAIGDNCRVLSERQPPYASGHDASTPLAIDTGVLGRRVNGSGTN